MTFAVATSELPLAYKWIFSNDEASQATATAANNDLQKHLELLREQEQALSGGASVEGAEKAKASIAAQKISIKEALKSRS